MKYNAGQLAKVLGVQTSTITRAIDKGRISAKKDEARNWKIDVSEIVRVYGDRLEVDSQGKLALKVAKPDDASAEDWRYWKVKAEFLEQLLADRSNEIERVVKDRDSWQELAKDTMRRLEPPKPRGWLSWLRGGA